MKPCAVSLISCGIALFWLPITLRFYKAWRLRQNPISLAIAWLTMVVSYAHMIVGFDRAGGIPPIWILSLSVGLSATACANFYFAFFWAKKKFLSGRAVDRTSIN